MSILEIDFAAKFDVSLKPASIYLPNTPHRQDVTQGQVLNEV